MTNVLYNEGFYTALTWMQLVSGLVISLLGIYAFTAMERFIGKRGAATDGRGNGHDTSNAVGGKSPRARNNRSTFLYPACEQLITTSECWRPAASQ